jgi:hypothetical protein
MPCSYCGSQDCRPNDCCHNMRTTPLSSGIVCSGCGYQCANIKWYNKDCLGREGVDKPTYQRRKFDEKFMDKQR